MLPDPRPYFEELEDPRRETKDKLHKLQHIIVIVFCSVLSGIEDWVGMEDFAWERENWLKDFLELAHGIPSHGTLSDVFGQLKPDKFQEGFLRWIQVALPNLAGERKVRRYSLSPQID